MFLARKGLMADSVVNASLTALEGLRATISSKDRVITLQGSEIQNLLLVIKNLEDQGQIQKDLFFIEKAGFRQKIKLRNRIILGLSGSVVVLLAIIAKS